MTAGDVVTPAEFSCDVARRAQTAWHTFVKNRFLVLADEFLVKWVGDEGEMRRFEECVRGVSLDVRGFSGARLVGLLRPLALLPAAERERLERVLDRAFEEEFAPDEVAERVAGKLDVLLARIRESLSASHGPAGKQALDTIRAAARGVAGELQELPEGFWLAREPLADVEARTA